MGQEAWTKEQQEQEQQQNQQHAGASNGDTTAAKEPGYEGWVWDHTFGWYYDEDLATQLLTGGVDVVSKSGSDDGNVTASVEVESESESESETDSDSEEDGTHEQASERKKQRRKRRRRSLAPRTFPRSKAQRLVDEAEDSVDGARPETLDLSKLDMDRVTSRVYRLDWLQSLDLSNNRLHRISPDLAGMESLVDVNFRHNRWVGGVSPARCIRKSAPNKRAWDQQIRARRGAWFRGLSLARRRRWSLVGFKLIVKQTQTCLFVIGKCFASDLEDNHCFSPNPQLHSMYVVRYRKLAHEHFVFLYLRLHDSSTDVDVSKTLKFGIPSSVVRGRFRIQVIPDELEALTKLKHLQLGHNRISGFRGNIYLISSLETLDLGHNR